MIVTVLVVAQKIHYIVECADQTIVRAHALTVIRQPTAQMLAAVTVVRFKGSTAISQLIAIFVHRFHFNHFGVIIAIERSMQTVGRSIENVASYALICA